MMGLLLIFTFIPTGLSADAAPLTVEKGRKVKIQYVIKSEGKVVDRSEKKEPAGFQIGEQAVLFPAFEKNIMGMKAGEKKKFELKPEETFGPWDPQKTQVFNRSQFQGIKLKPGMPLMASHSHFEAPITGRVSKIIGEEVGIDFNHPLAGKTLQAEVKILEVK